MSKILDNPAAYAAGLMDGEGCIRIVKYNSITYKVTVEVKMCDIEGVRFLYDFFGGKLSIRDNSNPNHRSVYSWMLHGRNACTFLNRVSPYLQVKRRRAEIAILCGETAEYSYSGNVPQDVLEFRERCFNELTKLNLRGASAAETERKDSLEKERCDSPNCIDGKDTELPRNVEVESTEEWI